MDFKNLLLICHILWLVFLTTDSLKIGISKPSILTTTLAPNTTTIETTTENLSTEIFSSTTVSTTTAPLTTTSFTTTSTSPKTTTVEPEWPEFPPKKSSKSPNKTTTKKPLTTTLKPSSTTPITIKPTEMSKESNITDKPQSQAPTSSPPKRPITQKYCFCDLTKDLCDTNCCCDNDCSPEAFQVFRCEVEKPIDLEVLEGRFEDFKFQHGLPTCEVNDGWLCVFRTYKPVVKQEMLHSYEDTSRYNKWPNLLLESEEIKNREIYKFGDILRIVNMETKEIQNLDLPASFQSPSCHIQEPIYHLKPLKRSCLITSYENLNEIQLRFQQLQEKYKIFLKPQIPDDLYNNKPKANILRNITLQYCIQNQPKCTKYKPNLEKTILGELYKIQINILHNFTNIHHIIIKLWLKEFENLNIEEIPEKELWLSYEVEFYNKTLKDYNKTNLKDVTKPVLVSGPLGYLPGKPLIIGRYIPFNKSLPLSSKNQVINYFSTNNSESHTLSLFSKENGECKRFELSEDFIQYGVNAAKYCKIKLQNETELWEDFNKNNYTQICLNLQRRINEQLFGSNLLRADLSSYLISVLGKPENNTHKWLKLQVLNSDFDSVIGQYLHETNTFVCRNILLSLSWEFHMSTVMVHEVPLQNIIKHAALHLAERHDLEFALDENLEVPITMTVRFYDVHEKAVSAAKNLMEFGLKYFIVWILVVVLII